MKNIVINTRNLLQEMTGVQRYTLKNIEYFPDQFEKITPKKNCFGIKGHIWEQMILPIKLRNKMLWSPSSTGPIFKSNQVVTLHDMLWYEHPEWFSKSFSLFYKLIVPIVLRRAKKIIVISEYTKKQAIKYLNLPSEKFVTIHNGVDEYFRVHSSDEKISVIKKYHLSKPFLLCVGSLKPNKNLNRLFLAWNSVSDTIKNNFDLVVVGGTGKNFSKVGFHKLPDGIKLLGHISDNDLPLIYSASYAFIFPSLYEGFGLPILEAMACGVPVITSNVTAIPEIVGDAAILVDPYSVEEILSSIEEICSNNKLYEDLVKKGIARVSHFHWKKTSNETWKVLNE